MDRCDIECNTWHDILIKKGFNPDLSRALIGFISWNKGEEFEKLGKEITEVLSGHEGKVFVKDVASTKLNDKGLLFFNMDIPQDVSNNVFDAIMDYEQNEVYNTLTH